MGNVVSLQPTGFAEQLSRYHAARTAALFAAEDDRAASAWGEAADSVITTRATSCRSLAAKVRVMIAEQRADMGLLAEILADLIVIDMPADMRERPALDPLASVMMEQGIDPDIIEAMALRYADAADQLRAFRGKAVAHG